MQVFKAAHGSVLGLSIQSNCYIFYPKPSTRIPYLFLVSSSPCFQSGMDATCLGALSEPLGGICHFGRIIMETKHLPNTVM